MYSLKNTFYNYSSLNALSISLIVIVQACDIDHWRTFSSLITYVHICQMTRYIKIRRWSCWILGLDKVMYNKIDNKG